MNMLLESPEIEAPRGGSERVGHRVMHWRSREEVERHAQAWDALAGDQPFRSRMWNMLWWDLYGRERPRGRRPELCVLAWIDDRNRIRAVAPWYVRRHPLWGRVVSFLGEDEVCGDYLGLLCRPGDEDAAARRFAHYLLEGRSAAGDLPDRGDLERESGYHRSPPQAPWWDVLDLAGVEVAEPTVRSLVDYLRQAGCPTDRRPAPSGWRIALPKTWSDYLAGLSSNARRRFRRLAKQYFHHPRLQLRRVRSPEELADGFAILERLHQALWTSRGQPGCFASPRFREFHRRFARDMLAQNRLNLVWVEWEGRPIVAEYQFHAAGTLYTYQSGMDPEAMHLSPGNLGNLLCIEDAIRQGCRHYDFCRGDEPYKAYLGAEPRPMCRWRVAAPHRAARLRFRLWRWAKSARQFGRHILERRPSQESARLPESDAARDGEDGREDPTPATEEGTRRHVHRT